MNHATLCQTLRLMLGSLLIFGGSAITFAYRLYLSLLKQSCIPAVSRIKLFLIISHEVNMFLGNGMAVCHIYASIVGSGSYLLPLSSSFL